MTEKSGPVSTSPIGTSKECRLLQCGDRQLDLSVPQVMGVLNVTPDSFSDGGALNSGSQLDLAKVLRRCEQMINEGAAIIDVGGESTRPGAETVTVQQEMDRVLPVVEAIKKRFATIISVDTSSPELMSAAASAGAGLINDVRALERSGAVAAVSHIDLPICLMHMQGSPQTMQDSPLYGDVVKDVSAYLRSRVEVCIAAGVSPRRLILDPGFGFGKSVAHNLQLLNRLSQLSQLGLPLLVGLSRKSLIGSVLGREVGDRMAASVSLAVLAVDRGASIIRAHDIRETVDAVRMAGAVIAESAESRPIAG